jgi:hypothetical protein
MKKTIIHSFEVTNPGEKVQLQIRLPRNARRMLSITVTATALPPHGITDKQEAGWLWLRIPERRDVFFAEIVRQALQTHDKESFAAIRKPGFGRGRAWIDGTKHESFSIEIDLESTLIEGYYTDQLKEQLKEQISGSYTVRIYINLDV